MRNNVALYSLLRTQTTILSQIVCPLVNPQVKLLAKSKAIRPTLVKTISKWLGFLGVEAEVTQFGTTGDKIQISLTVGKPDSASDRDWQTIMQKIARSASDELYQFLKRKLQIRDNFTS